MFIFLSFNPVVDSVREITEIIQSKFEKPCCTWGEVDEDTRRMWFGEWAVC